MKALGKGLMILIVIENSLGGGGRLFDTGPVSPRMVLFGFGLIYSVWICMRREKIPREFVYLTGVFITLCGFSTLISILEGQSLRRIFIDFKPHAYFLLLPFFAISIRNAHDVLLVSRIWKSSALILSVLYLIVMSVWKLDLVTTQQLIDWLNPGHDPRLEFYFRGETTFFFKALLYVGIGVIFFAAENVKSRIYAVPVLLVTIALTMTRGMWLSVFIILSAWTLLKNNNRLKGVVFSAELLIIGVMGVIWINETLPSVAVSNELRMNDMKMIYDHIFFKFSELDWQTVLSGHGFGATIIGRESIEFTYANVAYKQGISGILFWFFPFLYLTWMMRSTGDPKLRALAMPFFMSAALVYVISFTNPFLTNPIGMSVVMIAMVAVRVIRNSNNAELLESTPRPSVFEQS